jgi:hypothetical protein
MEKTIKDMQTDIDFLVGKYGKLEVATRSLQMRVEELEGQATTVFNEEDMVYLKELLHKRKEQIREKAVNFEITPKNKHVVIAMKEESDKLDQVLSKTILHLSK